MNWLDEFANSKVAKRVVFANYMDHLKLKNEGKHTYATIEEALQDFAQRTGLSEMQKRALRRQMFVKVALDTGTKRQFEMGDAPAAILPGIEPGSKLADEIEQARKKPYKKIKEWDKQQANKDVENARGKDPEDPGGHVEDYENANVTISDLAHFRPGLVIEAAEGEDEWAAAETPKEHSAVPMKFKETSHRPRKKKGPGTTSKEKKLLEQLQRIQTQLVEHFMEPGGTISNPKWTSKLMEKDQEGKLTPEAIKMRKRKFDLLSEVQAIKADLAEAEFKRKQKQLQESPKNKAGTNNTAFLTLVNKELNVKDAQGRKGALRKLSPEGLQDLYDQVMEKFRDNMYRRPSQGYDPEHGEYVKCMICGWINPDNPGVLPVSHLEQHEDELLAGVDLGATTSGKWRAELLDGYLKKYPGAALQSREHELANFLEREMERADGSTLYPPHVATKSEKGLKYSDEALIGMVLHQFRRFGVDPDDQTLDELARETLDSIKKRLNEEFPNKLMEVEYDEETGQIDAKLQEIGDLESKDIPFEALHRAFREEVGEQVERYRGTFSTFKPPMKRRKRRYTQREREEQRQKHYRELRREEVVKTLRDELGKEPTEKQIRDKIKEMNLIPVSISVTGGRACWNCSDDSIVYVPNTKMGVNSATCPRCGVYREYLVELDAEKGDPWTGTYVIRDINENDPGGPKTYVIYENTDYIGDGPNAVDTSRFVHILQQSEQEIHTRVNEPEPGEEVLKPQLEVGSRISKEPEGNGTVQFVQGAHMWVWWDNNQYNRGVPLKDLEGEVVKFTTSRPGHSGAQRVTDVVIDQDNNSVTVHFVNADGVRGRRKWDLSFLNKEAPVATEVNPNELSRVESEGRRVFRQRVVNKLIPGGGPWVKVTVDRYVKSTQPTVEEEGGEFQWKRQSWLLRRVKRARLLQRIGVRNG